MSSVGATEHRRTIIHVGLFWVAFALLVIGFGSMPRLPGRGWHELAIGVVLAVVSLGLITLLLRREGLRFNDVGLATDRGTIGRFGTGMALGVTIVLAMLTIVVGLTSLRVTSVPTPDYGDALGFSFLVLLVLAFMEEVAFRSFPMALLRKAWGIRVAIYITAIVFALYHGPDPMNLLGPGVWGLLYGLAAVASRGIALPLGIHLGANWTQSLFGLKVRYASGLWEVVPGSEAGILPVEAAGIALQLMLLVAGVVLIERFVRRRGGAPPA